MTQNARPKVIDVSANPENPTTTDDLSVEVNDTFDDDGDEVTVSYAWLKNGETQSDYTENVLPSSATSKGNNGLFKSLLMMEQPVAIHMKKCLQSQTPYQQSMLLHYLKM